MVRLFILFLTVTGLYAQIGQLQNSTSSIPTSELREKAEQGDAEAQNTVGFNYHFGEGNYKADVEAVKWFKLAAEQGNMEAEFNLGYCYTYNSSCGIEDGPNFAEGAKWFLKAAQQGFAPAQSALGFCYSLGIGVPASGAKSKMWLKKAAEQGDTDAQVRQGMGLLEAKKYVEAIGIFKIAAEKGDSRAEYQLASCYREGNGVEKDSAKAIEWYQKSAKHGNMFAKLQLQYMITPVKGDAINNGNQKRGYDWAGNTASIISVCGLSTRAANDPTMKLLLQAFLIYDESCYKAGLSPTNPDRINAEASLIKNIMDYKIRQGY